MLLAYILSPGAGIAPGVTRKKRHILVSIALSGLGASQ